MASFLHKLGTRAFSLKWFIVIFWIIVLGGLGFAASRFMEPTSSSISIPGTEAQKALSRFNELFPDTGAQSGKVVVAAPAGKTVNDYKDQIAALGTELAKVPEVTKVVGLDENPAAVSSDKSIAYLTVQLKPEGGGTISAEHAEEIKTVIEKSRTSDLQIEYGGDIVDRAPGEFLGVGEIGGVVIALIVLLMTLGSLVAAGMPILIALVTVGVSMAGLFSLSHVIDINSTTPALAVMLGLAVGIDYSLFIINRYRTFVHEGFRPQEAVGRAIATAGNAVLFAAATVVIALSALSVVQIPFMTTMGLAAAATVAVAAVIAITLIPALLGIVGLRVFSRKTRKQIKNRLNKKKAHQEKVDTHSIWYRWGENLLKFRFPILLAALAAIAVIAWPAKDLQLGLPTDEIAASDSTQRKAYDLLVKGFGAGFNAPLLVVAEGMPPVSDADKAAVRAPIMAEFEKRVAEETAKAQAQFQQAASQATTLEAQIALQQQIQAAQQEAPAKQQAALVEVEKQVNQYAQYNQLKLIADRIAKLDGVKQATPILTADNGTKGAIQVIPTTGPSDQKTADLVTTLRSDDTKKQVTSSNAVSLGVTGTTALQMDINKKLADALPVYLAVVVGLSLVLLLIAFRSLLIPLKATLGFLLSVLAMFGALVAVFQWGWFGITDTPGPIVSFIPIIAIGILFGLAMDYEFFVVSGMQEAYHHNKNARKAVIRGYGLGSKVVVAAGLIMVAVFAGFVGNHDSTIQSVGFALAVGIFVDAFIVRLTIVPILMSLLGKSAWWVPKWLEKRLPNISIEGEEAPVRK